MQTCEQSPLVHNHAASVHLQPLLLCMPRHICVPLAVLLPAGLTCKAHADLEQAVSSDASFTCLAAVLQSSAPTVEHGPCVVVIACAEAGAIQVRHCCGNK